MFPSGVDRKATPQRARFDTTHSGRMTLTSASSLRFRIISDGLVNGTVGDIVGFVRTS
jgi:hypothetical protein